MRPTAGADHVDQPLQDEGGLALAVVHERADDDAVELLLHRAGKDLLDRIDRDPHRLPFARRNAGDRLQEAAGRRRKADGDLVDDLFMEHLLKLADGARARSRDDRLRLLGAERCPTIRSPSPSCLSTRSAKSCASWPVPTTTMNRGSRPCARFQVNAARRRSRLPSVHGRLDHEQHREEETADVRLLQEEQGRKRDRHDQQRRSRQVANLRSTRSSARRGGRGRRSRAPRPRRPRRSRPRGSARRPAPRHSDASFPPSRKRSIGDSHEDAVRRSGHRRP